MRPSELNGKKVVGAGAKIVGTVFDIEIDPTSWKTTTLHIELSEEAIETSRLQETVHGTRRYFTFS